MKILNIEKLRTILFILSAGKKSVSLYVEEVKGKSVFVGTTKDAEVKIELKLESTSEDIKAGSGLNVDIETGSIDGYADAPAPKTDAPPQSTSTRGSSRSLASLKNEL